MDPTVSPLDAVTIRWQTADRLLNRSDVIVADTVAAFPFSDAQRLEADYCIKLGTAFVRLLTEAVRSSALDARTSAVGDFHALASQRSLTPEQIFTFGYLALTAATDELALDPVLGTTSEPWPQVSQAIRRGVFDVLSAWTRRAIDSPPAAAITDQLTTLHSRALFDVALFKECHRSERFEHWLSLILMDVDNLAEINRTHGYGVGDRVLERMGILVRTYFRHHDWVARYSEDAIVVLLSETTPADALSLAERARTMVHERLTFRDHRTEQRASVTVSVAVVSARALQGEPVDWQRVQREAEAAIERAKTIGPNSVEMVEILPRLMSIDEAAAALKTDLEGVHQMIGDGKLEPVIAGRHVRLERAAVLRLAAHE